MKPKMPKSIDLEMYGDFELQFFMIQKRIKNAQGWSEMLGETDPKVMANLEDAQAWLAQLIKKIKELA